MSNHVFPTKYYDIDVILSCLLAWVIYKMSELDERQEELDKYSVYLDERANKLAMWEQELNQYDLKK